MKKKRGVARGLSAVFSGKLRALRLLAPHKRHRSHNNSRRTQDTAKTPSDQRPLQCVQSSEP